MLAHTAAVSSDQRPPRWPPTLPPASCNSGLSAQSADHLLVRLAADSGARRGELAVLRHTDLEGRVLTIERGLSAGALGSTKSGRSRRLTLDATTTELTNQHSTLWSLQETSLTDWFFTAPRPERRI